MRERKVRYMVETAAPFTVHGVLKPPRPGSAFDFGRRRAVAGVHLKRPLQKPLARQLVA